MQRRRGELTLEELDRRIQRLTVEKGLLWERLLESNNAESLIKALDYQKKSLGAADAAGRAFLFAPDNEYYTGLGFKTPLKLVPYDFLRRMAGTPMISSVIETRINQILEFSNFSVTMDKPGWTIRRRISRFDQDKHKITDQDKKTIEQIVDFLENGGMDAKFTIHDDFHDFLKVFPRDLLELDQGCFEIQRNRGGDVVTYDCVDSATIRLLDTIDPHNDSLQDRYEEVMFRGVKYWPYYAQVWRERILQNPKTKQDIIWYPWEMCFAIRNKTSAIESNGYGRSELEVLMRVVTWLLESMEYNGRFFTNGSSPRGFFTMKGGVSPQMLNDFRMAWRSMVTGWQNAHKIPIFEAEKIDWVSMQNSNEEMQFTQWIEFLTLVVCSVYKMDPSELGFRFRQQRQLFGESGQKERTQFSKDKGLKPILKIIQKSIDKYIVSELNPNYEFVFTGIDVEDEATRLEADAKKLANGMVAMQDKFREYTGREFDPEKDIILNSVYLQQRMQQMYGGQGMNQQVNKEFGEDEMGLPQQFKPSPEEEEKSVEGYVQQLEAGLTKGKSVDPITDMLVRYINQELMNHNTEDEK